MLMATASTTLHSGLQKALLDQGLPISTEQLRLIQEKVAGEVDDMMKEGKGESQAFQQALDGFGKGGAEPPQTETPVESPVTSPAEKKQDNEQKAQQNNDQTPPDHTPTEKKQESNQNTSAGAMPETGQEAQSGTAPTEQQDKTNELKKIEPNTSEQEQIIANNPERNTPTQMLNALRYGKELKKIRKEIDNLTKGKKGVSREIKKNEKLLQPLQRKRRRLIAARKIVQISRWICWGFGAPLSLFGVGEILMTAALYLGRLSGTLKKRIIQLTKDMFPFKSRIKKLKKQIGDVDKELQRLARQALALQNTGLLTRRKTALGSAGLSA